MNSISSWTTALRFTAKDPSIADARGYSGLDSTQQRQQTITGGSVEQNGSRSVNKATHFRGSPLLENFPLF
jgi:hypothetical protein